MTTKKLILVVNDEVNLQLTLSLILTRAGYQVATVKNNHDSILNALKSNISLIVLDFDMEDNRGLALLSKIQRNHAELPVIVLTQYSSHETINYPRQCEKCKFIEKPIDPGYILEIVMKMLGDPPDPILLQQFKLNLLQDGAKQPGDIRNPAP